MDIAAVDATNSCFLFDILRPLLLGFGLINLFSIGFSDVIAGHLRIGQTEAIVDPQCKMIPYYHSCGQTVETFHHKIVEYLPNTVKVDVISAAICVIMIPYVPIIDSPKQNSENTNIDTILSRSSSMPSTARACSNNNYQRQKYKMSNNTNQRTDRPSKSHSVAIYCYEH
jgi:hypothetical protein